MSVIELNFTFEKNEQFKVIDLESAMTNKKIKKERDYVCCRIMCWFLCLSFIFVPLSVVSIYLAYTDNSCMNKPTDLNVTLGDYLKVDGILYGLGLFFWTSSFTFIKILVKHSICFTWCFIIMIFFVLSWTILGTFIFSKIVEYCSEIIRQWTITLLSIHYVSFVGICWLICNNL
jgi:hypothetical protein